jgi:hypothetical protein
MGFRYRGQALRRSPSDARKAPLKTAVPSPIFLGSISVDAPLPRRCGNLGSNCRLSEDSLFAGRQITGGDVNPDCHGLLSPLVSGGPVAGRRLQPCPLFLASHGL